MVVYLTPGKNGRFSLAAKPTPGPGSNRTYAVRAPRGSHLSTLYGETVLIVPVDHLTNGVRFADDVWRAVMSGEGRFRLAKSVKGGARAVTV